MLELVGGGGWFPLPPALLLLLGGPPTLLGPLGPPPPLAGPTGVPGPLPCVEPCGLPEPGPENKGLNLIFSNFASQHPSRWVSEMFGSLKRASPKLSLPFVPLKTKIRLLMMYKLYVKLYVCGIFKLNLASKCLCSFFYKSYSDAYLC